MGRIVYIRFPLHFIPALVVTVVSSVRMSPLFSRLAFCLGVITYAYGFDNRLVAWPALMRLLVLQQPGRHRPPVRRGRDRAWINDKIRQKSIIATIYGKYFCFLCDNIKLINKLRIEQKCNRCGSDATKEVKKQSRTSPERTKEEDWILVKQLSQL